MERPWSVENLIEFIVDSARRGRADSTPFHHLQFDRVFPDDFYSAMLQAMPASEDYRAMSGKTKMASSRPDGKPTRAKIDLFPEYLRHLSSEKRAIWDVVGQALRDRKSTRLNSSHVSISYAVFCLKKKNSTLSHCSSHKKKLSRQAETS